MSDNKLDEFRRAVIDEETNIEGGYGNDPDDLGKETNHGITVALANEYKSELTYIFGWDGTMINLTTEMAYYIYVEEFWNRLHLDKIFTYSTVLCKTMFRWGLKSGYKKPVKSLQELLNVLNLRGTLWGNLTVDGLIGPKTLDALDHLIMHRGHDVSMYTVVMMINADQLVWMKTISLERADELNEKYTWGWIQRCSDEIDGYLKDIGGSPKL